MFEIQKSGDKTSSGEIGLDIRTHASPKVGQDSSNFQRISKIILRLLKSIFEFQRFFYECIIIMFELQRKSLNFEELSLKFKYYYLNFRKSSLNFKVH